MAAGLIAAVPTGIAAATAAATTAAVPVVAATTPGILAGIGGLTGLAAITSGIGAVGSGVASGIAGKKAAETAAEFADFEGRARVLEGRRVAVNELEAANKLQARQFAAIGAGGLEPTASAIEPALETGRIASTNLNFAGLGGAIEGRSAALQAEALRKRGQIALLGGALNAASRGVSLASGI